MLDKERLKLQGFSVQGFGVYFLRVVNLIWNLDQTEEGGLKVKMTNLHADLFE